MGLFPKDRDLSVAPDRVLLEVRASDFRLPRAELEIRLDNFLKHHLTWRSRTSIQRLIGEGWVLVEHAAPDRPREEERLSEERRASRLLRDGARVVVLIPDELRLRAPDEDATDLVILYEDDECLVVDKPAGLAVHPGGRHLTDTLIQRVHARYRESSFADRAADGGERSRLPIRLCHRLDRETSGVLLIGKGEVPHRHLMQQFEERRVEKEYLAVVHGVPELDQGVIEHDLCASRAGSIRLKMIVCAEGLASRTEWRVLERGSDLSLFACKPHTGRQHQIRVHLEAIGHPLIGDKLYGVDEGVFLRSTAGESTDEDRRHLRLERHALHHHRLVFHSPRSGARREVVSPLPADLLELLGS